MFSKLGSKKNINVENGINSRRNESPSSEELNGTFERLAKLKDNNSKAVDKSVNQKSGFVDKDTSIDQILYDSSSGQYTGARPKKPDTLKGTDELGQPLTAHHIYPWNKILKNLNEALLAKSKPQFEKLLVFASISVYNDFWTDLDLDPDKRPPKFATQINRIAEAACWVKTNIFMGPLCETRDDDPKQKNDASFSKSGIPTPASALGELTEKDGGIGSRSKLANLLASNINDIGGQEEAYDQSKWESVTKSIGKGANLHLVTKKRRKEVVNIPYSGDNEDREATHKKSRIASRKTKSTELLEKLNKMAVQNKQPIINKPTKINVEGIGLGF